MPENKSARIALISTVVILLLGGGVYGLRAYAHSRKLAALQTQMADMMEQAPASGGPGPGGGPGRRDDFRKIREQVRSLPESYQRQFDQSMSNLFQRREEKRYDEFLAMSPVERKKHLDKAISEQEKRRQEWEARRQQREAERGTRSASGGNRPGGGNGGNATGPANRGGSGGPQGQANSGGNRNRGGWGGSQSARLDRTTPELRAKRAEYRRALEQRRKELGLPPGGGWRR